ncbi:hypothetical protein CHUAL_009785 [Chamberlinius hualienensis]
MSTTTFSDAFSALVLNSRLLGFEFKSKPKFWLNLMFAFQIIMSLFSILYAYFKAELITDDIQKISYSFCNLDTTIISLVTKISFRRYQLSIAEIIEEIDVLFLKFQGAERQFLKKLQVVMPIIVLSPLSAIVLQMLYSLEKIFAADRQIKTGDETFNRISKYLDLDVLYDVFISPWNAITLMALLSVMLTLFTTVAFIFKLLAKFDANSNNLADYIRMHRDACRILRLSERVFQGPFLQWMVLLTGQVILVSRIVALPGKDISWSTFYSACFILGLLMVQILLANAVNQKMKQSLRRLQKLQLQLYRVRTLSAAKTNAIMAITDLYLTNIFINPPQLTVAAFIPIRPKLFIAICGFIISYTFILYDK